MKLVIYEVLHPYRAHTMWETNGTYQFHYSNIGKGWKLPGRLVIDGCFYNFVERDRTHVGVNPNDFEMDLKDLWEEFVSFMKEHGEETDGLGGKKYTITHEDLSISCFTHTWFWEIRGKGSFERIPNMIKPMQYFGDNYDSAVQSFRRITRSLGIL